MKLILKVVSLIALCATVGTAQTVSGVVSRQAGDVATRTDIVGRFDTKLFGVGFRDARSEPDRVGARKSFDVDDQEVFGHLNLPLVRGFSLTPYGSLAVTVTKNTHGTDKGAYILPVNSYGLKATTQLNRNTLQIFGERKNFSGDVDLSTLGAELSRRALGLRVGAFGSVSELSGLAGDRPYNVGLLVGSSTNSPTGFTAYGQTGRSLIDNPRFVTTVRELGLNGSISWRQSPLAILLGGAIGNQSDNTSYYRARAGVSLKL